MGMSSSTAVVMAAQVLCALWYLDTAKADLKHSLCTTPACNCSQVHISCQQVEGGCRVRHMATYHGHYLRHLPLNYPDGGSPVGDVVNYSVSDNNDINLSLNLHSTEAVGQYEVSIAARSVSNIPLHFHQYYIVRFLSPATQQVQLNMSCSCLPPSSRSLAHLPLSAVEVTMTAVLHPTDYCHFRQVTRTLGLISPPESGRDDRIYYRQEAGSQGVFVFPSAGYLMTRDGNSCWPVLNRSSCPPEKHFTVRRGNRMPEINVSNCQAACQPYVLRVIYLRRSASHLLTVIYTLPNTSWPDYRQTTVNQTATMAVRTTPSTRKSPNDNNAFLTTTEAATEEASTTTATTTTAPSSASSLAPPTGAALDASSVSSQHQTTTLTSERWSVDERYSSAPGPATRSRQDGTPPSPSSRSTDTPTLSTFSHDDHHTIVTPLADPSVTTQTSQVTRERLTHRPRRLDDSESDGSGSDVSNGLPLVDEVGIGIGCALSGVAVVAVVIIIVCNRHRKQHGSRQTEQGSNSDYAGRREHCEVRMVEMGSVSNAESIPTAAPLPACNSSLAVTSVSVAPASEDQDCPCNSPSPSPHPAHAGPSAHPLGPGPSTHPLCASLCENQCPAVAREAPGEGVRPLALPETSVGGSFPLWTDGDVSVYDPDELDIGEDCLASPLVLLYCGRDQNHVQSMTEFRQWLCERLAYHVIAHDVDLPYQEGRQWLRQRLCHGDRRKVVVVVSAAMHHFLSSTSSCSDSWASFIMGEISRPDCPLTRVQLFADVQQDYAQPSSVEPHAFHITCKNCEEFEKLIEELTEFSPPSLGSDAVQEDELEEYLQRYSVYSSFPWGQYCP